MTDPVDDLLAALSALSDTPPSSSTFACRLKLPAEALALTVEGVGDLRFPISKAQAKALVGVARPAPFGHGERTLVDRRVRDVWEIAKRRVRIDTRPWNTALRPALEDIRERLGLPSGRLVAKLHKLLVYETGQFFEPHRDTERDDTMVGTLVVTLPSSHRGGSLTVHHRGETRRFVTSRAADDELILTAFYADCTHEVKPLTAGYRVALGHELHFEPEPDAVVADDDVHRNETLERSLEAFFDPARPPPRSWGRPVEKLVFLLDHEYSPSALSWTRLKGVDSVRVPALVRAARRLELHRHLALVGIDETWSANEQIVSSRRHRVRRADRDWLVDGDEWDDDIDDEREHGPRGRLGARHLRTVAVTYELEELIERGAVLEDWVGADGRRADLAPLHADEEELCWLAELERFEPELEEYEGWMGNYGNTLERRYRRAAIVLWPARSHHRIRARAGVGPFVRELLAEARSGRSEAAHEALSAVLGGWPSNAPERDPDVLADALALLEALDLDDATLAAGLLTKFRLPALLPAAMPSLIALGARFGRTFCHSLIEEWAGEAPGAESPLRFDPRRTPAGPLRERLDWLVHFPDFRRTIRAHGGDAWEGVPALLFERLLAQTLDEHEAAPDRRPSERHANASRQARELTALLDAARAIDDETVAGVIDALHGRRARYLPDTLVDVLGHLSRKRKLAGNVRASARALATEARGALEALRDRADRRPDDWSIEADLRCDCEDCRTLAAFLGSSDATALDLPLRADRRAHLHRRIDERELPVSHETRRKGSPYVLMLRKEDALFENARRRLRQTRSLLKRLDAHIERLR